MFIGCCQFSSNHKHYPDLGDDTSSVRNIFACSRIGHHFVISQVGRKFLLRHFLCGSQPLLVLPSKLCRKHNSSTYRLPGNQQCDDVKADTYQTRYIYSKEMIHACPAIHPRGRHALRARRIYKPCSARNNP